MVGLYFGQGEFMVVCHDCPMDECYVRVLRTKSYVLNELKSLSFKLEAMQNQENESH